MVINSMSSILTRKIVAFSIILLFYFLHVSNFMTPFTNVEGGSNESELGVFNNKIIESDFTDGDMKGEQTGWLVFFSDDDKYRVDGDFIRMQLPNLGASVVDNLSDIRGLHPEYIDGIYPLMSHEYELVGNFDLKESNWEALDAGVTVDEKGRNQETSEETLLEQGYSGANVTIGIIDTGINKDHIAFRGKTILTRSFRGPEYGTTGSDPDAEDVHGEAEDVHGHGTLVSSVAAGVRVTAEGGGSFMGVAPNATLAVAAVDDLATSSGSTTDLALIAALDWLISLEVDVINLSYARASNAIGYDPVIEAIKKAVESGIVVLVSAGNSGNEGLYSISSLGGIDQVITVGASDETENGTQTSLGFSSQGPTAEGFLKPDIVAPGVVQAAKADSLALYEEVQGTSFSSPYSAGSIALLIQAMRENGIDYNPGVIKAAIMKSAQKIDSISYLKIGAGLLDIHTAYFEISNAERDASNIPLLFFTPASITYPTEQLQTLIYHETEQTASILVVSSVPSQLTAEILNRRADDRGYLDIELSADPTAFSQHVTVTYKASSDLTYNPKFTLQLSDGVTTENVSIEFRLDDSAKVIVGIDMIHTNDVRNRVVNSLYSGLYIWGLSNNIGFVELRGDALSRADLEAIDILFVPSPNPYAVVPSVSSSLGHYGTYNEFKTTEIEVIKNWVTEDNGSLLFLIDGKHLPTNDDTGRNLEFSSTNVSALSGILEEFDIKVSDSLRGNAPSLLATPVEEVDHPILQGVSGISYEQYGGITISSTAFTTPLFMSEDRTAAVAYSNGGRAVFLYTLVPFTNNGYLNKADTYDQEGDSVTTQNDVFVRNVVNWLREGIERNDTSTSDLFLNINPLLFDSLSFFFLFPIFVGTLAVFLKRRKRAN